jgi:hypothetical protein
MSSTPPIAVPDSAKRLKRKWLEKSGNQHEVADCGASPLPKILPVKAKGSATPCL